MATRSERRTYVAQADVQDVMNQFLSQSPAPSRVVFEPDGSGSFTVIAYWDDGLPRWTINIGARLA